MKCGGLDAARLAMRPDRVEHDTKHGHEDHHANDQHEPMQPSHIARDLVHSLGEIELIDAWPSGHVLYLCTCDAYKKHGTGAQ